MGERRAAGPGRGASAASRWEAGAEERLAGLVAREYPDTIERIRMLLDWVGFPPRYTSTMGGTPWYELAPERMLLTEPPHLIFDAVGSEPLTATQLDGAAELFTCLDWTRPLRAEIPDPLRSMLIAHVTATGTDPMRFRTHHRYGAERGT